MPAGARDILLPIPYLYARDVVIRPVDYSIGTRMRCEQDASMSSSPYWAHFPILINQELSRGLVINSEVIISCFNHSLPDSLTLSTQQFGQAAPTPTSRCRGYRQFLLQVVMEMTDDPKIDIVFMAVPGLEPQPLDPHPNSERATCSYHHTFTANPLNRRKNGIFPS